MNPSDRKAIDDALCNQQTAAQLSSAGETAKRIRKESKMMREARAQKEKAPGRGG
jgi:hypothetical protein